MYFIVIECKDKLTADAVEATIRHELREWDYFVGTREAHYVAADVAEDTSRITVMVLDPEEEK